MNLCCALPDTTANVKDLLLLNLSVLKNLTVQLVLNSANEFASSMLPSDCAPGEYLNVNKCSSCEAGFVCVEATSQKYTICTSPRNGQFCTPSDGKLKFNFNYD